MCSFVRVLELRVREPPQALDEHHHRRDACARDLGSVVQRARGQPMGDARYLATRLVAEVDEHGIEQDRLDLPDPLPDDVDPLLLREALARLLRCRSSSARLSASRWRMVEELLGRLDDGRDDARLADDAARRADGAVPDARGDVADLERELRRAGERVAAAGPSASSRHARPGPSR